jgi:hypothetical protein
MGLEGVSMSQTRDRLSKLVGLPKKVHLTRGYPGDPTHNGFVLGLGRDLVLLHQFHDFYPEGYVALRVADIKRTRSGEHERFWEAMFRGEGLLERVGIPYEVPLDDFRSLLTALHGRGQHVIVECEDRNTAEYDDFFIGRVVAMDDETASVLNFDSMGAWNDEPSVIAYGDITQVQFDTPYINTISKYLKEPPATNGRSRS